MFRGIKTEMISYLRWYEYMIHKEREEEGGGGVMYPEQTVMGFPYLECIHMSKN